jgi:sec-independent protein translocase protein TatA
MFLKGLEGWHVVIIVGLVAVLFGSRKMPDAARAIGQSLRIFKSEVKAARTDEVATPAPAQAPAAPAERPAPQEIEALPQLHTQREHTSA